MSTRERASLPLLTASMAALLAAVVLAVLKPQDWRWWLTAGIVACVAGAVWVLVGATCAYRADKRATGLLFVVMALLLGVGGLGIAAHLAGGWPFWSAESVLEEDPGRAFTLYASALERAQDPGIDMRLGWRLRLTKRGIVPADTAYFYVGQAVAKSRMGDTEAAMDLLDRARDTFEVEGRTEEAEKVGRMMDVLTDSGG